MRGLLSALVELGDRGRLAAALWNAEKRSATFGSENDDSRGSPAPTARIGDRGQFPRRAAGDIDPLQLLAGEKSDGPAVGGEERGFRAVGARELPRLERSRVVYSEDRNGPFDLYEAKLAEPGKDAPLLATPLWKYPETWSPDGRFIVYTEVDPKTRANLWVLPRTGEAKPYPFLATPASESIARFSPDGRFLAYASDESGREEVYVQPFPATGAKWQISTAGGSEPGWRGDMLEAFYLSSDFQLMSVTVSPSPSGLSFGPPQPLFRVSRATALGVTERSYALSRDGQRFLVLQQEGEGTSSPITVVIGPAAHGESKR
jgi:hypothetical protein